MDLFMNLGVDLDLLIFGPWPIWFLACAVVAYTIVFIKMSNRSTQVADKLSTKIGEIVPQLKTITDELRNDNGGLKDATKELRDDTSQLTEELGLTRKAIEEWHATLKRTYWWIPNSK